MAVKNLLVSIKRFFMPFYIAQDEAHPGAYEQGFDAHSVAENPYSEGGRMYLSWMQGFEDRQDLEQRIW